MTIELLVESRHAAVERAFLRAPVAGGGEPAFGEKKFKLYSDYRVAVKTQAAHLSSLERRRLP